MFYVYILRSIQLPEHIYIGYTTNLKARLKNGLSGNPLVMDWNPIPVTPAKCLHAKHFLQAKNNCMIIS